MTIRIALARRDPAIELVILEDGARAVEYFSSATQQGDLPPCSLILLDLNLPRVSGFEVLAFLKGDPELKKVPVVVLSGSSSRQDVDRCYAAGANCYVCKPTGINEVFDMAAQLVTFWFDHATLTAKQLAFVR
jgi:CheY-like chemotaxis protein